MTYHKVYWPDSHPRTKPNASGFRRFLRNGINGRPTYRLSLQLNLFPNKFKIQKDGISNQKFRRIIQL